ncbi:LysR family transcriptional regulator [Poseidonocella sp. HB161398]|uniref:LysR family transcriptional regulator n=1 Tax=Poseidonocella sp. HB161398 TaxID=2320855 RepID=UPI0011097D4B|nr:LysR family transcriptional regulator [Poseidonocella sp. HB161398]
MQSRFRNWSDVRNFLAVVREGSTLAASRKLGIAQPTVARRIGALEHETGLALFEHDTRGFRPTAAARALVPLAEAIEAAAEAFAARTMDLAQARPIRITAFVSNFSPRVTDILSEFSLSHPGVQVEFLPGVKPLDLLAGEADIALRISRETPDPSLICRKISSARFTLFGAPSYARGRGLPASAADLAGHVFVSFQSGDLPSLYQDWLLRHVAPEQIIMSFSEFGLMEAAVRMGQGLGILNLRMAEADEAAGRLLRCFEPPEDLTSEHLLLVSPEAYRRPEVRAFAKFFAPRYAALFR